MAFIILIFQFVLYVQISVFHETANIRNRCDQRTGPTCPFLKHLIMAKHGYLIVLQSSRGNEKKDVQNIDHVHHSSQVLYIFLSIRIKHVCH